MSLKKPRMLLFDLDGTLVDSVPDLAIAIDIMMTRIGRPVCGNEQVRNWVGNGVERLVRRALVGAVDGEPDDETFRQAYPLFMEAYAEHNGSCSRLYPGVKETLIKLKGDGYQIGCVTNKAAAFTLPLLKQMGIFDNFEIVICGDTLSQKKPHPMPLLHAADFFGADPGRALMIGDSVNDVKAARAAGFAIVCMTYGYNHGLDIRDAEPDAVMDCITDLPKLLGTTV